MNRLQWQEMHEKHEKELKIIHLERMLKQRNRYREQGASEEALLPLSKKIRELGAELGYTV